MNQVNTFNLESTFNISTNVFHSDLKKETVILNLKSGIYFGLDQIGTRIWILLEQSKTVLEIRNTLLEEYEVETEQCDRDLQELLQKLLKAELIELANKVSKNTQY